MTSGTLSRLMPPCTNLSREREREGEREEGACSKCLTWSFNSTNLTRRHCSHIYRGLLYSAQSAKKKDPGRARQNSLAKAGTNFTKPGAQNKGNLCSFDRLTEMVLGGVDCGPSQI